MLTIRHCRKSLLFCTDKIWIKKSNLEFDVTMGSFGGAEICELVGFYIIDQLSNILPVESFGLYRDNGLAILSGISGPDTDQIIKNIRNLFKTNNLKITIEAGMQKPDYLDVMFNAYNGKYWPYEKPNSQLQYIHIQSPDIKKQLLKMIEKRLSGLLLEVGVAQNSLQVAQMRNLRCALCLFFQLLRNLRCALCLFFLRLRNLRGALCLFFKRLRNLRLRIGKSNICCASIGRFFPRCAITK